MRHRSTVTLEDRLTERMRVEVNGCHLWLLGVNNMGYGLVTVLKKRMLAHRHAWELSNGPIPKGLVVHHKCKTRLCVNVRHMELKTQRDHLREEDGHPVQMKASQTHCIHGHVFTTENTRVKRNGTRCCKACDRARSKQQYARSVDPILKEDK